MKIGIIGGTGGMGEGFALRWCINNDILIGSRDKNKAQTAADEYYNKIKNSSNRIKGTIRGSDNISVAKESDVIILSIPYENIERTCNEISSYIKSSSTVVSPIVPMGKNENGFYYIPMEEHKKSAATLVAENLPNVNKIISAFHTISEIKLKTFEKPLEVDTFICTDNRESLE